MPKSRVGRATDQVQVVRAYSGSLHAFREILRHEGVRGLYRAYPVHQATWAPFNGLYFAVYEKCKAAPPRLPWAYIRYQPSSSRTQSGRSQPKGRQAQPSCIGSRQAVVAPNPNSPRSPQIESRSSRLFQIWSNPIQAESRPNLGEVIPHQVERSPNLVEPTPKPVKPMRMYCPLQRCD